MPAPIPSQAERGRGPFARRDGTTQIHYIRFVRERGDMAERNFLIIADISNYTSFFTGSELDHAQGVLEKLFAVILERLQSPLHL